MRNTIHLSEQWEPFKGIETLCEELGPLAAVSLKPGVERSYGFVERGFRAPLVDIQESGEALIVRADLPGLQKEDIEVTVQADILTLKGERKTQKARDGVREILSERGGGSFIRSLQLPSEVEVSQVKAVYHNGVLELTLPKREEDKPKQIRVEVKE